MPKRIVVGISGASGIIYGIRVLRQIQGTVAAFSTKIGDVSFASAGMICRTGEREGKSRWSGSRSVPARAWIPARKALRARS